MTYQYKPKRITRTCDNCHNLLRKADMYEPLNDSQLKKLCSGCFQLWLDGQIGDLR